TVTDHHFPGIRAASSNPGGETPGSSAMVATTSAVAAASQTVFTYRAFTRSGRHTRADVRNRSMTTRSPATARRTIAVQSSRMSTSLGPLRQVGTAQSAIRRIAALAIRTEGTGIHRSTLAIGSAAANSNG